MNRKQRRAYQHEQKDLIRQFSEELKPVPEFEFPDRSDRPAKAWRSRKYLVQLWDGNNPDYPELMRLTISRTKLAGTHWKDGITWDELQRLKREVGYGDWYAVEVYPRDRDLINVANMRHLWLLPKPLPIGWLV